LRRSEGEHRTANLVTGDLGNAVRRRDKVGVAANPPFISTVVTSKIDGRFRKLAILTTFSSPFGRPIGPFSAR